MRTSPHDLIRDPLEDPTRMSAYPNLEYGNLYNALTMLIDVAPCIQYGQIGNANVNPTIIQMPMPNSITSLTFSLWQSSATMSKLHITLSR